MNGILCRTKRRTILSCGKPLPVHVVGTAALNIYSRRLEKSWTFSKSLVPPSSNRHFSTRISDMSSTDMEPLVRQIHDSQTRLVLSFSGGGSETLSALLSVPGASRTVLEAVVPYSQQALCRWLAGRPDQFCSARTARAMAMSGFLRACEYESPEGYPLVGVGATASLATDRRKAWRSPDFIWPSQTVNQTVVQSLELTKGRRTRPEEEAIASALILNLIARSLWNSGPNSDCRGRWRGCPAAREDGAARMERSTSGQDRSDSARRACRNAQTVSSLVFGGLQSDPPRS